MTDIELHIMTDEPKSVVTRRMALGDGILKIPNRAVLGIKRLGLFVDVQPVKPPKSPRKDVTCIEEKVTIPPNEAVEIAKVRGSRWVIANTAQLVQIKLPI